MEHFQEAPAPVTLPSPASPTKAVVTVTFRHPLTGDEQTVPATVAAMVPLMNKGYQQVVGK